MSQALLEQVEEHRKDIKHEVLTYALSELVNMYMANPPEMNIQPEWQRLFRWSREQQSSFIESLILEVPIPPLFFFEAESGQWELLDGLQRMSTILKFMGVTSDVPIEHQGDANNDHDWHYETQNDVDQPLQLTAPEYLTSLDGLSFARLPVPLKLNLKRSRIQIYVLKRETHRMYKYEVFKRLNTGGSDLEEQELRNCAVRILDNEFPDFLKEIAKDADFASCIAVSEEDRRQGYADELALRFFTMKNYGSNFRHDVGPLLTKFMEAAALKKVAFDYTMESDLFRRTFAVIARAFGDGTAFRGRRKDGAVAGSLSPTLFELVALAVAWSIEDSEGCSPDQLRASLIALVESARAESLTGSGSNSRKKTVGRLDKARAWKPA
jgi:hypothetical protein